MMGKYQEVLIQDLFKKIKKKKIPMSGTKLLAGDASPRRYFIIKQGEKEKCIDVR